jgi:hypothetical protein
VNEWRKPLFVIALVLAIAVVLAFVMPHTGQHGFP